MAERALAALAGLAGLLGVAVSAAAAHAGGGTSLDTAGRFLLIHAAAMLAVASALRAALLARPLGTLAGFLMAAGTALFCGDLARRGFQGAALFPMAAPVGGVLLMSGWFMLAAAALWPRRG
jgi:uncharacterized membrane protein YgdD (TMEM256/DUF423 family)